MFRLLLAFALLLAGGLRETLGAGAEPPFDDELQHKIEELEKRVLQLEETVKHLQSLIKQVTPLADENFPVADQLGSNSAEAQGFSEAKELVLSMNSMKYMLDLDSGLTMDPPATHRPEQARMDVKTDQVQPYHYPNGLIGRELHGVEVKSSDWDASAAEVRRTLAGDAARPLKHLDVGPGKNKTYLFKTRDGALGVIQFLEIVHEPKGIRLRYKIVQ